MVDLVLRLDRSKPFAECRGDRTPDDPHYKVAFLQGSKVNGTNVLLPFDSADVLVPDDGRTESWQALNTDGKMAVHHPLYSPAMRELVTYKLKKLAGPAVASESAAEPVDLIVEEPEGTTADDVNFASWLRGEAKYEWIPLQKAAKARFSRIFQTKRQMVEDLVCDERLVPEAEVCPELAKLLPARAA